VNGAIDRSEKVRKLFSNIGSDCAVLRRPDISGGIRIRVERKDGCNLPFHRAVFEANRICEQQALTIPIGKIRLYRPTRITQFRLERVWRASHTEPWTVCEHAAASSSRRRLRRFVRQC